MPTRPRRSEPAAVSTPRLLGLALAVGVVAGLGAVAFRAMIALAHNLLLLGRLSLVYDANVHTPPSPWGALIIAVPALAALAVVFLVKTFAPEAKGHGVPEVMDAIYANEGRIRPAVTLVKSAASALSIGSGGSVGREGPIVQIGAAFGSVLGQLVAMPSRQRVMLVASGAGAGIGATFNTPIGGLLFALEVMMPAATPLSVLLLVVATVVATLIGQVYLGAMAAFEVPALQTLTGPLLGAGPVLAFAVLGVLVGLLATLMVRGLYWAEDVFESLPGNDYTRHVLGMLLVGLLLHGFATQASALFGVPGHYYVEGVGYATIMDILAGRLDAPGFLLLLVAGKLAATFLTLGSGASGGVFSPCLYLGAALGGAVGHALAAVAPALVPSPVHFALAGMAGMVAGTTGAFFTGAVMLFEMTGDYGVVVPVVVTAAVAGAVRAAVCEPTIYTLKLRRRGHLVPQGLQAWFDAARRARDVMDRDIAVLEGAATPAALAEALAGHRVIVVPGPGDAVGAVYARDVGPARPVAHVMADAGAPLGEVLRALDAAGAAVALVTEGAGEARVIVGAITDRGLAALSRRAARLIG